MSQQIVGVVGLGYVGLPLAVLAARKGWQVVGVDKDAEKVRLIQEGISPLKDEALQEALHRHRVTATTDPAELAQADVVVVAVPTPVHENKLPDLTPLKSALTEILPHLKRGVVLIVESTINPGVMDEVVVPLIVAAGLRPDSQHAAADVYAVHCPERINPGDATWTVETIPRVLGGYSTAGTARAKEFYESILTAPVRVMATVTEAESVKILENSFRDVNIAFINEMAKSFDKLGIDILHVIAGASTKPFAYMPHYPGNGVGGHCISVDPYYMIERGRQAGFDHEFLKLARHINDGMPQFVLQMLEEGLTACSLTPTSAPIALLGLAYKKDIDDTRESPALTIRDELKSRGYDARVYDPYVPALSTVATLEAALTGAPVVMLATDHKEFVQKLSPEWLAAQGVKLVIDGKNALDADGIAAQGILYLGVGRRRTPSAAI